MVFTVVQHVVHFADAITCQWRVIPLYSGEYFERKTKCHILCVLQYYYIGRPTLSKIPKYTNIGTCLVLVHLSCKCNWVVIETNLKGSGRSGFSTFITSAPMPIKGDIKISGYDYIWYYMRQTYQQGNLMHTDQGGGLKGPILECLQGAVVLIPLLKRKGSRTFSNYTMKEHLGSGGGNYT